ncbi:hypothetical protein C8R45DRAFT_927383 [Mycena sanguinolenta]|nr:hypothetical protein C8R45DRAFT_927383 [Mycena sanguinolenta]
MDKGFPRRQTKDQGLDEQGFPRRQKDQKACVMFEFGIVEMFAFGIVERCKEGISCVEALVADLDTWEAKGEERVHELAEKPAGVVDLLQNPWSTNIWAFCKGTR